MAKLAKLCLLAGLFCGIGTAQTAHFVSGWNGIASGLPSPTGVAIDSAGNVYIADQSANKVYKETLSNGVYTQSIIASGFQRAYEVAVDSHGNVFVADANVGSVFLLTPPVISGGNYTQTLVTHDGAFGVTVDASDNVLVVANSSKVYKETYVSAGSYTETTLVTPSGCSYATSVAVDTGGNLYIACDGNNLVVKETPAGGGSYSQSSIGSGLSNPSGVAVDTSGNVYIADQTKNRLLLETLSSGSYTQSTIYNGSYISGVGLDSGGTLYVADTGYQHVIKQTTGLINFGSVNIRSTGSIPLTFVFDTGGTLASTAVLTQGATGKDFQDAGSDTCSASTSYIAGASCVLNVQFSPRYSGVRYGAATLNNSTGAAIATAYLMGTGSGPQVTYSPPTISTLGSGFSYPQGVAVDGSGNVFVGDSANNAVKEITASSGYSTVKTVGSGFSNPAAVAVDSSGDIFVADVVNNAVKEIVAVGGVVSSSSTVITVGSGFSHPEGVAVDGSGNVFVADNGHNQVKEIVAVAGVVSGSSTVNVLGSGFSGPFGVAVDGSGNVFVADYNNNAVKEILAAGGFTTVNTLGSGFSSPGGVAVDGSGNVYVADTYDSAVKEIVAGTGGAASGTVNSSSTVNVLGSGFSGPYGVAVDGSGNVFVADYNNNAVKEMNFAAVPTLHFATTVVGFTSSDSPKTVTFTNIGNVAMTLPIPSTGNNPAIANNFFLNSVGGSACPLISSTAGSPGTLAVDASCTLPVSFIPIQAGSVSGSLVFTDTALNQNYAQQSIPLSGNSTVGVASQVFFATPPAATIISGGNAGSTVTVNVQDPGMDIITGSSAPITVTVTGPGGYSQTYGPINATKGVAVFNLSAAALSFPGAYTYTATSPSLSSAIAVEVVDDTYDVPTEPVGTASGTQTAVVEITSSFTLSSISAVTQGATGLDYGFVSGGTCNIGTAYTAGQTCTVNYSFTPKVPGLRLGAILLSDSTPRVQATVYLSGTGSGPLGVLYPGTQSVVAHSGLNGPRSIAVDASGSIYVDDLYNNRVLKETLSGGSYTQSVVVNSGLNTPQYIALDGAGNVYIADSANARVLKETLSGGSYTQSVVANSSNGLSDPVGLAVDGSGNVYISDDNNSAVYLETLSGGSYTQSVVANYNTNRISSPYGLAVNANGSVYICDYGSNRVLLETPSGGGNYTQSQIPTSSLNQPLNVAVDANGDVYISDYGHNRVLMETPAGGSYTERVIANTSMNGVGNIGGLAVDGSGNVYIGDEGNAQVLKLDVADTQTLAFPSTYVGYAPSLTESLLNIGNATLTIAKPGSGTNPGVSSTPAGFLLDSTSTCPQLTPSSSAATLAMGAGCTYVVDFVPSAANSFTGSVVLTDNSPNSPQTLLLTGSSSIQIPTKLVYAVPPPTVPTPVGAGGNAGIVTVNIEGSDGHIVLSSAAGGTAGVTLTVTGPAGYSQAYGPTAAVAGVATFNLSSVMLTTVGTYTYTATSSSLTPAVATEKLLPTEPVGTASTTQTATVVFSSSFTLHSIQVLTQGATGLDFKIASGGTCTVGNTYNSADTCTVNYTFTPTVPGLRMGAIVLSDSTPTVQATVYLTGTGTGPLAAFYPATQSTIGGGWGNAAGVAVDASGNVYIVDQTLSQVVKETPAGSSYTASVIANSSVNGLNDPTDVAVDGAGNVYIADQGNGRVLKETLAGGTYSQSVVVSSGTYALTVDGSGNVYLPNGANVVKETLSGGSYTQSTIGSGMQIGYGSVRVDAAGNLFIGDQYDNQVVKETLAGGVYTQSVIANSSSNGLSYPVVAAVDASGNVYVLDYSNSRVLLETPSGGSYTQSILATNLSGPIFMTIDGSGNLYISNNGRDQFLKLDVSNPPAFSFPTTTNSGTTDTTDGPQTATFVNIGNSALSFPAPGSGNNPSISTNFILDSSNTCPVTASGAGSPGLLAIGASCTVAVDFAPAAGGSLSGSLVFTDNSTVATQTIGLSGTGVQSTTQLVFGTAPPSSLALGANAGSLTVQERNSSNALVNTATDAITLTVTGPNSYSQTYGPTAAIAGVATFNVTSTALTTAGSYTYTAAFSPLTSAVATVVVNQATQAISFTQPTSPVVYGVSPITLTATGGASGNAVVFSIVSGPGTVSGSTLTITGVGTVVVAANQTGNTNYSAATQLTRSVVVNQATATVILGSLSQTYTGATVAATATTNPTGLQVSFTYNGSSTAPTAAGSYTVVGTINDPNYQGSSTATLVVGGSTLTISANNASRVYGTANPAFSGNVTGQLSGNAFTESFTTSAILTSPAGTYSIVPAAAGSTLSDYTQSIANGTLTVTQAGTTSALGLSSGSVTPGQSVTMTVQVASSTTGMPTGTVSFYDNGTLLNAATLSSGAGSYSTASLAAGITHTITAVYSGDTNFTGSSSSASATTVIVAALDFTVTIAGPSSLSVAPGGSIIYQVTVSPNYGAYAGTVNFAVSGLPPGSTASFSPSSIASNSGPQTITVTIQTVAATAATRTPPKASSRRHMAPFALAFLVLFGAGGLSRRRIQLKRLLCMAVLLAGGAAMLAMSGCGGSNGFFTQSPQNYTVTITVSSGGMQHNAAFTLNLQ